MEDATAINRQYIADLSAAEVQTPRTSQRHATTTRRAAAPSTGAKYVQRIEAGS